MSHLFLGFGRIIGKDRSWETFLRRRTSSSRLATDQILPETNGPSLWVSALVCVQLSIPALHVTMASKTFPGDPPGKDHRMAARLDERGSRPQSQTSPVMPHVTVTG